MSDALVGTDNFTVAEWERKSSGGRTPDAFRAAAQATLEKLQSVRDALGVPVVITSAWRSPDHNAEIKGSAKNSQHMTGEGVDFVVPSMSKRDVALALDAADSELAPYHQLIYYLTDDHFHLGIGSGAQRLVLVSPSVYVPYVGPDTLTVASKIAASVLPAPADDGGTYDPEPAVVPWGILAAAALVIVAVVLFNFSHRRAHVS